MNIPTVTIETHGCKLNQADSSVMAKEFSEAGFTLAPDNSTTDIYIVNTCTVTHIADRKARHAIRAARRKNPNVTIVATGCYAQRSPEILQKMPEIDLILGNSDKKTLVNQVYTWWNTTLLDKKTSLQNAPTKPIHRTERIRPSIKIQEGCDQICAYCIVPKVRGRERSIPPETIVQQINYQISRGHKEIVLTGTQLGSYGFDLPDINLPKLLGRILSETDITRLRVSSIQPQEIDNSLLNLWSNPRLCPHFHLALQSGSDRILKNMRRRYTKQQYLSIVKTIRETLPEASITTDIIVGFPGETEPDFDETYSTCKDVGFAAIHVFPYSNRPGTSASHFDGGVDPSTKSNRTKKMLDLAKRESEKFRNQFLGTIRPVLWETQTKSKHNNGWIGLTDNYIRVIAYSNLTLSNKITSTLLLKKQKNLVVGQITH